MPAVVAELTSTFRSRAAASPLFSSSVVALAVSTESLYSLVYPVVGLARAATMAERYAASCAAVTLLFVRCSMKPPVPLMPWLEKVAM